MKKLKLFEYIVKKIVPFFLISLIFVSLILNLVDLFMNISKYLEMNAPAKDVLKVMLYYTPKTLWYGCPIAFLFSVTYILSDLYANNEMEALFASGVSLYRFVFPVFVIAFFLSIGMFFLEDKLVVSNLDKKIQLQNKLINAEESKDSQNVVVQTDSSKLVYKALFYDDNNKELKRAYFIFRNDEKKLDAIIYANVARWDNNENKWILENPIQYIPVENTVQIVPVDQFYLERLTESYETFRTSKVEIESVNIKDASIVIEHLKNAGLPYGEALSLYYKKFAFPFIMLIASLLAVGLTGRTRKNVLLISLSLSIIAVVLYYVLQMITMVMAKTEFLTPFMGAWFPNILFGFLSVLLLKYCRT